MEWSVDVKSPVSVQLSFLWFSFPLVNVDDLPKLSSSRVTVVDLDVSVFGVLSTRNINYLSTEIDNLAALKSEELPPS